MLRMLPLIIDDYDYADARAFSPHIELFRRRRLRCLIYDAADAIADYRADITPLIRYGAFMLLLKRYASALFSLRAAYYACYADASFAVFRHITLTALLPLYFDYDTTILLIAPLRR